eukprot:TRINITY_DN1081_c0_g1_i6.p1 TRINITY_DN1081_c0_g1~~TRINITY_DN1081_c0_g1_i6.p1  ORF type:complete len:1667 (-),score=435.26 TRINITY_DN1081_c0_g1_i6:5337-10337(-)
MRAALDEHTRLKKDELQTILHLFKEISTGQTTEEEAARALMGDETIALVNGSAIMGAVFSKYEERFKMPVIKRKKRTVTEKPGYQKTVFSQRSGIGFEKYALAEGSIKTSKRDEARVEESRGGEAEPVLRIEEEKESGSKPTQLSTQMKARTSLDLKTRELSSSSVSVGGKSKSVRPRGVGVRRLKMDPALMREETKHAERLESTMNYLANPRFPRSKVTLRGTMKNASDIGARVISVEPQSVEFRSYVPKTTLETTLWVINEASHSVRIRVLPPQTSVFSISLGRFPSAMGQLAPGMRCSYTLRFLPDSIRNYEDTVIVEADSGQTCEIRLSAQNDPPRLEIPDVIDCSPTLVDDTSTSIVRISNIGAPGDFWIIGTDEVGHEKEFFETISTRSSVSLPGGVFSVTPASFHLEKNQEMDITIEFSPTEPQLFESGFVVVMGNGDRKSVTIEGSGGYPMVALEEVERKPYDQSSSSPVIAFQDMTPGGAESKEFVISNPSPVPLHFVWEEEVLEGPQQMDHEHQTFEVFPRDGIIRAHKKEEFSIRFCPSSISRFDSILRLKLVGVPPPRSSGHPLWKLYQLQITRKQSQHQKRSINPLDPLGFFQKQPLGTDLTTMMDDGDTLALKKTEEEKEMSLEALEFRVCGSSRQWSASIFPLVVNIPGRVIPGRVYEQQIEVRNDGDSEIEFAWDTPIDLGCVSVDVIPFTDTIPPKSGFPVTVNVMGLKPSQESFSHDIICRFGHGITRTMCIQGQTGGAQVEILEPVINFGLVEVGATASWPLTLKNKTNQRVEFILVPHISGNHSAKEEEDAPTFVVAPSEGVLRPNETLIVSLFFRPMVCADLEGKIECAVVLGESSYVAVQGKVQTPVVLLDHYRADLGRTYVDIPVSHKVRMKNQTSLPCSFKWHLPETEEFVVICTTDVEEIPACGELDIELVVVTRRQGTVEIVIPCVVAGMDKLIGVSLSARVIGIKAIVELLKMPANPSLYCSSMVDAMIDDVFGVQKLHSLVPAIDFGVIPVGSSSTLPLRIRNMTACKSRFTLSVMQYGTIITAVSRKGTALPASRKDRAITAGVSWASEMVNYEGEEPQVVSHVSSHGDRAHISSEESHPYASERPRLGSSHERTMRFRSSRGMELVQTQLRKTVTKQKQGECLASGRGCALVLSSAGGKLDSWDEVNFEVSCMADMPGVYEDEMRMEVIGLPRISIPIRVQVVGSPLHVVGDVSELSFRTTIQGSDPIQRRIQVENICPYDLDVHWFIGKAIPHVIDVGFSESPVEGKQIMCHMEAASEEEELDDTPFLIKESSCLIPAGGKCGITLTFETPQDEFGTYEHRLVGVAKLRAGVVFEPLQRGSLEPIEIRLQGQTVEPNLDIHPSDRVLLSGDCALSYNQTLKKKITLKHTLFAASHMNYRVELQRSSMPHRLHFSRGSVSASGIIEKGEEKTLEIKFDSTEELLANEKQRIEPDQEVVTIEDSMEIILNNLKVITIPISVRIFFPAVQVAPRVLRFHVIEGESVLRTVIRNPSRSAMRWTITHEKEPNSSLREELTRELIAATAIAQDGDGLAQEGTEGEEGRDRGKQDVPSDEGPNVPLDGDDETEFVDDPTVFEFSRISGSMARGTPFVPEEEIAIRFVPKEQVPYRSFFRVTCSPAGRIDGFVVEGWGLFSET